MACLYIQDKNKTGLGHETLVMLNIFMYYTPPKFLSINLQHSSHKHVFSIRTEISEDPNKMALSEAS